MNARLALRPLFAVLAAGSGLLPATQVARAMLTPYEGVQCPHPQSYIVEYLERTLRLGAGVQRGDSGRPAAVAGPTLETVGIVDARDSVEPAQIIAGWIRSPDGRIVGRRPAMWVWLPEVERAYALNDVAREASDLPGVETLSPDLTISENDSAMGEVMTCLAL